MPNYIHLNVEFQVVDFFASLNIFFFDFAKLLFNIHSIILLLRFYLSLGNVFRLHFIFVYNLVYHLSEIDLANNVLFRNLSGFVRQQLKK